MCRQFGMGAAFDNAAVFHHQNEISLLDSGQPMRDHQCCPPPGQFVEGFLYLFFRGGIERTGSLIKQQHRRILEDRLRNGDPLTLAARQPVAALPDTGGIAVGLGKDKLRAAADFAAASTSASLASSRRGEYYWQSCHQTAPVPD